MIKELKHIPVGGVFFLPQYPGNVYRHNGKGKAEFVEHRLNNAWRGHPLTMGDQRLVATDVFDEYETCLDCGNPIEWPSIKPGLCHTCQFTRTPECWCGKPVAYNIGLCEECARESGAVLPDETLDLSIL